MIAIKMMGGLGNLCFQIATGETWRKKGWDVRYTHVDENLYHIANNFVPKRNAEEYKGLFPNFNWDQYKLEAPHKLLPRCVEFHRNGITPREGTEFMGYFQSEKNFPDRNFILWLFEPNDSVKAYIDQNYSDLFTGQTCSIHVRRQDYVALAHYHNLLSMDYYIKAGWVFGGFNIDRFLVFSDDIPWCRQNFKGDKYVFIDTKEYYCLYLMGKCNHNIIANSSLSWWGAWLAPQKGRMVVAPKKWFNTREQNSQDVIPYYWKKI